MFTVETANCFDSAISYSLDKLGCSHLTFKDEQRLAMKAVYDVFLCLPTGKTTLAPVHHTVPLMSNLTRSCESLASRSRVQLSALARRIGYTRENTGLHSREHWATLARTLGYTRENTWLHSRGHLATLARTISCTRELYTRGHLATVTLTRPLGYSNTREAT